MACLRFSTIVRTKSGKGEEIALIAQPLLESRTCAYIDWLDDNFIRLIIIIHNKDALLVLLSAKENQQAI